MKHSFTDKKSQAFPGLFRTPVNSFQGLVWSQQMFKYKEKTAFSGQKIQRQLWYMWTGCLQRHQLNERSCLFSI